MDNADADDYLDDGEELGNVDPRIVNVIRQAISRGNEHARRLSRDLEEGFMDDSDDDDDDQLQR